MIPLAVFRELFERVANLARINTEFPTTAAYEAIYPRTGATTGHLADSAWQLSHAGAFFGGNVA